MWLFAMAGLVVCGVGTAISFGVLVSGLWRARRGGVVLGAMLVAWWVPAACASVGLLRGDAAVVGWCLGLWGAGLPVIFGSGYTRGGEGRVRGHGFSDRS